MGMDPDRMAAVQMNQERWQAQLAERKSEAAQRQAFQQAREERISKQAETRLGQGEQRIANLEAWRQQEATRTEKHEGRMTAKDRALAMAKVNKELEDSGLISDTKVARRALDDIDKQRWWNSANKETAKAKAQAHLTETEGALSKLRRDLLDQYGVEMPTETTTPSTQTEPAITTQTPSRFGNDTMPDVIPKRVRVRSPEGKTGTLPENQVDEAVSQGWTRL